MSVEIGRWNKYTASWDWLFFEKIKISVILKDIFGKLKLQDKLKPNPENLAFSKFIKLIMVTNGNFLNNVRFLTVLWSFLVIGCVFSNSIGSKIFLFWIPFVWLVLQFFPYLGKAFYLKMKFIFAAIRTFLSNLAECRATWSFHAN